MGFYDYKLRKKVNWKAEKERAQILRKEKEVMMKITAKENNTNGVLQTFR